MRFTIIAIIGVPAAALGASTWPQRGSRTGRFRNVIVDTVPAKTRNAAVRRALGTRHDESQRKEAAVTARRRKPPRATKGDRGVSPLFRDSKTAKTTKKHTRRSQAIRGRPAVHHIPGSTERVARQHVSGIEPRIDARRDQDGEGVRRGGDPSSSALSEILASCAVSTPPRISQCCTLALMCRL